MEYSYRNAVASDVLELISLVQEYCTENKIEYDNSFIKNYIDFQLGKLPAIVAVNSGTVVGVISYVVMPSPFSKALVGRKIAYFVNKDHRDNGVGTFLLNKAEEACKASGATKFYLSSTAQPEGYSIFETEYFKELN